MTYRLALKHEPKPLFCQCSKDRVFLSGKAPVALEKVGGDFVSPGFRMLGLP